MAVVSRCAQGQKRAVSYPQVIAECVSDDFNKTQSVQTSDARNKTEGINTSGVYTSSGFFSFVDL
jgi:hypothetical protein